MNETATIIARILRAFGLTQGEHFTVRNIGQDAHVTLHGAAVLTAVKRNLIEIRGKLMRHDLDATLNESGSVKFLDVRN